MQPTTFQTLTITAIDNTPKGQTTPTVLSKGVRVPMRVLISNVGPVPVFIADETVALTPISGNTFQMLPGDQMVFVISPTQSLYAIGAAAGGRLSISMSEAVPTSERP